MSDWFFAPDPETELSEQGGNTSSYTTPAPPVEQSDFLSLPGSETLDPHFGGRFGRGQPVRVRTNIMGLEQHISEYGFLVEPLGEIEHVKKNIQEYLWTHWRHFQLEMWAPQQRRWGRMSYDSSLGQISNLFHINRGQERWDFRLHLNRGRTPSIWGEWY